jgi:alpha-mannosidase
MAHLAGAAYPREEITLALEGLLFTMFHDAITATHVDAAYDELQDVWADIDRRTASIRDGALAALVEERGGAISVLNLRDAPTSQIATISLRVDGEGVALTDGEGHAVPVLSSVERGDGTRDVSFIAKDVGGLSAKAYTFAAGTANAAKALTEPTIENERFRVDADKNGILAIYDKKLGREVASAAEYRPGELVIEHDVGSPWATISPDRARAPLSGMTKLVSAEAGAGYQRLTFEVDSRGASTFLNFGGASFGVTCTTYDGLERVDFRMVADWNNYNCRLRVAMPVPQIGDHAYGVPYGTLQRRPYEPGFSWAGANGDWPAVNWAGVGSGRCSVALLSKGLPSYCIEDTGAGSRILLSVLRSPAMPTYLHEPVCYVMTDYDGMRDAGVHEFEYALAAYDCAFAQSAVVRDADAYNAGLVAVAGSARLPDVPTIESDCARMSVLKQSEDGTALVVRLAEFRGRGGEANVTLCAGYGKAFKTNLLEREAEALRVAGGACVVPVRPWEIVTLRLER